MSGKLLELTCKSINGLSFHLTCFDNEDIETEVKKKIADRLGCQANEVRLIYEGKCVYGDYSPRTLGDFSVRNGGTLHLVFRRRAG